MISKECYVYLQMPESFEMVTVGRLEWQKDGPNFDVGKFIYGSKYLSNSKKFPLDPFNLPLQQREFENTLNEGIHGPIRDASPDSWGRYVITRNTPVSEHHPIGFLLNSAGDRIGALSFGVGKVPPAPVRDFNKTIDLEKLILAAHKLENGAQLDETEKALLMKGPSVGGARPKATVENNNSLWIAKFPAVHDKENYSTIEYATMKFAEKCGIRVPEVQLTKIGAEDVFLIKRFDRKYIAKKNDYYRSHFVSGLTLLNLDERDRENWSYLDMADQMRRWIKKPQNDLRELFKRIVFNGLISNTDDHPRNHGFLLGENGYRLSPLYDVVPKAEVGSNRSLAMPFGDHGRIFSLENLLTRSDAFDLSKEEAREIFGKMKSQIIGQWHAFYSSNQVEKSELEYLRRAFSHHEYL